MAKHSGVMGPMGVNAAGRNSLNCHFYNVAAENVCSLLKIKKLTLQAFSKGDIHPHSPHSPPPHAGRAQTPERLKKEEMMKSHPFEPKIRAAFKDRAHHDAASLLPYIATDDPVSRRRTYAGRASGWRRIYREVQKALDVMERQRMFTRDKQGWYYLVDGNARSMEREECVSSGSD